VKRPPSRAQIDIEGCLPRSVVLNALYKARVNVTHLMDGRVSLEKELELLIVPLDDPVGGLMVRNLIRRFDLNLEDIYANRLH